MVFPWAFDHHLCPDFTVGALINYSTTGADFGDGSRLGAETGLFGLYSAWHPGKWHLNTFIAGGYTSYDIDRATFGSTANAHPSGSQATGDATGGYDIDLGHHARLIPELGLTYTMSAWRAIRKATPEHSTCPKAHRISIPYAATWEED